MFRLCWHETNDLDTRIPTGYWFLDAKITLTFTFLDIRIWTPKDDKFDDVPTDRSIYIGATNTCKSSAPSPI